MSRTPREIAVEAESIVAQAAASFVPVNRDRLGDLIVEFMVSSTEPAAPAVADPAAPVTPA